MNKILEKIRGLSVYNEEFKWIVGITILIMLCILLFTSRTRTRTNYIGGDNVDSTTQAMHYYIIVLENQDSTLNEQKNENISNVDSLSRDELYNAISDFIRSERKRD